jgi:DNA-binding transcriptional LysR family regulator
VITEFVGKYPAVRVELILLDRVVDLVEEGLDVAVRIGHLPDSSLVALPIGATQRVVCASPAYLKHAGTPAVPADLARHRCLTFGGITPGDEWTFADRRQGHTRDGHPGAVVEPYRSGARCMRARRRAGPIPELSGSRRCSRHER